MRPEAIIRVVISKGVGEVVIPAVHGSLVEGCEVHPGTLRAACWGNLSGAFGSCGTRQRHRPKSRRRLQEL